ncbi:MAG: hypothetical protein OQL19_06345 [Gammaproteobacteria bacterium]|nr:hypothetical protein [Gammaproteobacteria bacterium]
MSKKEKILTKEMIIDEIKLFRQQQKTLILATQSPVDVEPNQTLASYAPFIEDETGNFYLLLSGLASHSVNLKFHQNQESLLSILLIEDEQTSRNLFARKRLNYTCTVSIWPRDHSQWQEKIDQFKQRFGKTIDVLSSLGDFNLYCLIPMEGNYVRGFGQAYKLIDGKNPILRSQ